MYVLNKLQLDFSDLPEHKFRCNVSDTFNLLYLRATLLQQHFYFDPLASTVHQEAVAQTCSVACNFIEKETLAQVFSCEFCEISKNTFFHRTPLVAASVHQEVINT